jgi:C-terminal processing protease CtpA/Prc
LVLNYPEANIHLTPNSHFNEPFDYSYIGFKLYEDSGRITIDNIAENSPAEKSGLQNGDEVLGVNNNFSNNIDSYKKTISRVNSKVKMSILRKNQIKTVVVLVESVL